MDMVSQRLQKWKHRKELQEPIVLSLENKRPAIDYEFEKKGDYLLDGERYFYFKRTGVPSKIFKLSRINMKNNELQMCFKGNYNGRELYRVKVYSYTIIN